MTKIDEEKEKLAEQKKLLDDLMHDKHYQPMRLKDLCILLQVPKERREEVQHVLDLLVEEGRIAVSSHGKYGKAELFSIKGVFSSHPRGFGFVRAEGREQDLFIPPDAVGEAMHGDSVLAAVTSASLDGKREEGRIVKILEHSVKTIVGTYQKNKKFGFVIPDNRRILSDLFIDPANSMEAEQGDKVIAEILSYGTASKNPEGKITEILGHRKEPGVDILSIARAHEIPMEFPEDVKKQLESIPSFVTEKEKEGRLDLRDLPTVTIDGEDAKDLDDAVSLSKRDGIYELGVHIADVSHYVTEGSPLDREAIRRGTSVYLIDRVIPMLPQALSNGICSLNQGEDRLALSCLMQIDEKGNVLSHRIAETLIRVNHRMTYTKVASILTDHRPEDLEEYADTAESFELMRELSAILRQKRFNRGAIDFDSPEAKITLDEKGRPVSICAYEHNIATDLIEDFMLLTNETVSEEYFWMEVPFVYRVHEKPDEEKMRRFAAFINNFGYAIHLTNGEIHPKELQKLLEKIDGTEAGPLISRVLLRSMKQARYSTENIGHFGLSARFYSHFTSPIRRYPDLQIHRIIKENLSGKLSGERIGHFSSILPGICESSSSYERRAQEAEREVDKLKKTEYMKRHIGEVVSGVISGVTASGFYVELPNTVEGMVSVSALTDDYYIYQENEYQLIGQLTGKIYRPGQEITVLVDDVDLDMKTIDFVPADSRGIRSRERFR